MMIHNELYVFFADDQWSLWSDVQMCMWEESVSFL